MLLIDQLIILPLAVVGSVVDLLLLIDLGCCLMIVVDGLLSLIDFMET